MKKLPCPFCGSAYIRAEKTGFEDYQVECHACGARGPLRWGEHKAQKAWDKRSVIMPCKGKRGGKKGKGKGKGK
jgi:Lar family restriction alleviation protein